MLLSQQRQKQTMPYLSGIQDLPVHVQVLRATIVYIRATV
jgi:hypothetical protein